VVFFLVVQNDGPLFFQVKGKSGEKECAMGKGWTESGVRKESGEERWVAKGGCNHTLLAVGGTTTPSGKG
jgi:hypothetical protein